MLNFISNYPLLFVAIVLILVFVLLWFIIKTSRGKPTITNVIEKKTPEKEPEQIAVEQLDDKEQKNAKDENNESNSKTKKKKNKEKRVKKIKEKRSIEQVFKREEKQTPISKSDDLMEKDKPQSTITEEELLSKMEFVKSSRKVSKLVKLSEKEAEVIKLDELVTDEPYLPPEPNANEKTKSSRKNFHLRHHANYFDKSKRLSKFVKEDNFDEMFDSHISDDYLDIDISRHLDTSDDVLYKLYDRASKTLANSDKRLISDEDEDTEKRKTDKIFEEAFIEGKRREIFAKLISGDDEEEISEDMKLGEIDIDEKTKLDTKTLLVADAVIRRKGRGNKLPK